MRRARCQFTCLITRRASICTTDPALASRLTTVFALAVLVLSRTSRGSIYFGVQPTVRSIGDMNQKSEYAPARIAPNVPAVGCVPNVCHGGRSE